MINEHKTRAIFAVGNLLFWTSVTVAALVLAGMAISNVVHRGYDADAYKKIKEDMNCQTTFETLLVNENGDAVHATFTVDNNDVIYFITTNRWQMCVPREK